MRWTKKLDAQLIGLYVEAHSHQEIAEMMGLTYNQVKSHINDLRRNGLLPPVQEFQVSAFPVLDQHLVMEGNALIIPDLEAPFHHAEFLQRCVHLAQAWGIKKLILAGDILHFSNLSAWGAEWQPEIGEDKREKILDFINALPDSKRQAGLEVLEETKLIGSVDSISEELHEARKVVSALNYAFEEIHYVMGNHDDRYLRTINRGMRASELLNLLCIRDSRWKIAPYYFSELISNGEKFRIVHPKNSGMNAARVLAEKYHAHIIMAHSHRWSIEWDRSGKYWAIQSGAVVDERRLYYVASRDSGAPMHKLGATIVRDGYPYVLSEESQWDKLERM